ncbi:MAG TPA: hypothetical protein VHZ03_26850 [Trebonia sp.]|nr:hypothetical protein [Trebonia sp.]
MTSDESVITHPDSQAVHPDGGDETGTAPSTDQGGAIGRPPVDGHFDQAAGVSRPRGPARAWPLLILALPAAIAVWSGWVGIGQMTGFGEIRPLPGIWDSLHLETAVTLPIGVEAYAAFALRVWLASNLAVSDRTRRFARCSAIAALGLGMSGQVAYHLLAQAGVDRAPWEVTTVVSCLPVVVLGLGSALAHLIRGDSVASINMPRPELRISGEHACQLGKWPAGELRGSRIANTVPDNSARPPARTRLAEVQAAVAKVRASGHSVSRRSLRAAGLHGSNADLGMLARRARRPHSQPGTANPADS